MGPPCLSPDCFAFHSSVLLLDFLCVGLAVAPAEFLAFWFSCLIQCFHLPFMSFTNDVNSRERCVFLLSKWGRRRSDCWKQKRMSLLKFVWPPSWIAIQLNVYASRRSRLIFSIKDSLNVWFPFKPVISLIARRWQQVVSKLQFQAWGSYMEDVLGCSE